LEVDRSGTSVSAKISGDVGGQGTVRDGLLLEATVGADLGLVGSADFGNTSVSVPQSKSVTELVNTGNTSVLSVRGSPSDIGSVDDTSLSGLGLCVPREGGNTQNADTLEHIDNVVVHEGRGNDVKEGLELGGTDPRALRRRRIITDGSTLNSGGGTAIATVPVEVTSANTLIVTLGVADLVSDVGIGA
jgi:hypothetical protein